MSAVVFRDVALDQGGRRVLSGVSFVVEPGQFVGVLGPNGSGKTTVMRAIVGLLPVTAGSISVCGAPVRRGNPAIGYGPQLRRTLADARFTGFEVVLSGAGGERWGLPWATKRDRAAAWSALERVGGSDLANRPIGEMSGGERQRLMIAQALLGEPRLLLLDEPLVSLDPARQADIVALVAAIARERNIAVLFSAHEVNPLVGAIDRVLYLARGHAATGTIDEVVTGPVLSRLYGSSIDVVRVDGRIFVMSGRHDVERGEHCGHAHSHEHGHGEHAHGGHSHAHDHGPADVHSGPATVGHQHRERTPHAEL